MDISIEKNGNHGVISLATTDTELQPEVDKALKDFAKRAQIKGFRPGTAPLGLVKKMVGSDMKFDVIQKEINKNLTRFIQEQNIQLLTYPTAQPGTPQEGKYSFAFDVLIAPEDSLDSLVGHLSFVRRTPELTPQEIDNEVVHLSEKYHQEEPASVVTNDYDYLTFLVKPIVESEDSGFNQEVAQSENFAQVIGVDKDAVLMTVYYGDLSDALKAELQGKEKKYTTSFDIESSIPDQAKRDRAYWFFEIRGKEKKGQVNAILFNIQHRKPLEVGPALFEKVYAGEGITEEAEFRSRLAADIQENWNLAGQDLLEADIYEKVTSELALNVSDEVLESILSRRSEFGKGEKPTVEGFRKFLRWEIVQSKAFAEGKLEVSDEDILESMRRMATRMVGADSLFQYEQHFRKLVRERQGEFYDNAVADAATRKTSQYLIEKVQVTTEKISLQALQALVGQ